MAASASTAERSRYSRPDPVGSGAAAPPGAKPGAGPGGAAARQPMLPALRTDAAAPTTNSRREICAAALDPDGWASLTGLKFLRELHPDGARPGNAGVYRLLSAQQRIALRVAVILRPPVEHIAHEQFDADSAPLCADVPVEQCIGRLLADQFSLGGAEVPPRGRLVDRGALSVGLPLAVECEAIPRRQIAFEFRGSGQLLPRRRCVRFGDRRAAAVVVAARGLDAAGRAREVAVGHRQYGVQPGEAAADRQRARGCPFDRGLDAADSSTAGVLGLHDAVQAGVGELEVIPVFLEYRAVDA